MPKSKHRRKPGGKTVAHPGRRAPERLRIDWPEQRRMQLTGVSDLPLWRAPEEELERQMARDMQEAFEHFAPTRLPPELVAEYRALQAKHARLDMDVLDRALERRLIELDGAITAAIPEEEVRNYLMVQHGYGTAERPLPAEVYWDTVVPLTSLSSV